MILTVTPNTGIDHTLLIPRFEPDKTIRAVRRAIGMAGKPADASWILGKKGIPSLALGFAAGDTGCQMETMLRARGVTTDFVWVDGETRINTVIVTEAGEHTTITEPSLKVSPAHQAALIAKYHLALESADCVIMGGTLPPGIPLDYYVSLILAARQRDIPVLFDCSGPALRQGLEGRPSLIKPNQVELGDAVGGLVSSIQEVYQAANKVREKFGALVVATLGVRGSLAVLEDRSYYIPPLPVKVASPAGAGDGMLAGLAVAFSQRMPVEEGLRMGTAFASAILMTLATADYELEEYERLLPQVELIPYRPGMELPFP